MIITGNASSQVTVDTRVQGEGSTYTYIESEVNGQKKILETNEPGRYEVKIEASPTIIYDRSPEPSPSPTPEPSIAPSMSPSPEPSAEPQSQSFLENIKGKIAQLISKLKDLV